MPFDNGVLHDVMEDDWLLWYINAFCVEAVRAENKPESRVVGRVCRDGESMRVIPCDPGGRYAPALAFDIESRRAANGSWLATVRWEVVPDAPAITTNGGTLENDPRTPRLLEEKKTIWSDPIPNVLGGEFLDEHRQAILDLGERVSIMEQCLDAMGVRIKRPVGSD